MSSRETVMGEDGNKEQPENSTQPHADKGVTPPSFLEKAALKALTHPRFMKVAGVLGIGAIISNVAQAHAQADVNKETLAAFSSNRPSIGYHLENGMPSASSPEISASLPFTETVKPLLVDRPTIEQEWAKEGFNHYEVVDTVYVHNQNGDVSQMLTLTRKYDPTSPISAKISMVSESHLDPATNQFTEYKASTFLKLPIQNSGNPVGAIAVSLDGTFGLVGGDDPAKPGAELVAFFDGWKIPQEVEWPFPANAGIIDILPLTGTNSFLINLGNFEGGISMYIADVDPVAKKVKVRATNISGSAWGLSVSSVDIGGKSFKGVAGGSYTLQGGVVIYDGGYETGTVTTNHIDKVKVNGQEITLPNLYGATLYKDKSGDEYILASDPDLHYIYNINSKTREATRINYMDWFGNRGIANYLLHSLEITALRPLVDAEGKVHVWFGGGYGSLVDGGGRAVVGHYILGTDPMQNQDTLTPYYLSPNKVSNVGWERGMKIEKIAGQSVLDITIDGFGKGVIFLNPDWSPAQGGIIYYLMRGLGAQATVYRIYTPVVSKNQSGGW